MGPTQKLCKIAAMDLKKPRCWSFPSRRFSLLHLGYFIYYCILPWMDLNSREDKTIQGRWASPQSCSISRLMFKGNCFFFSSSKGLSSGNPRGLSGVYMLLVLHGWKSIKIKGQHPHPAFSVKWKVESFEVFCFYWCIRIKTGCWCKEAAEPPWSCPVQPDLDQQSSNSDWM